jgi:hypothetical protein
MKKIVRITESDLVKIVKRIINESSDAMLSSKGITFNGVNISPVPGTGHLLFKSGNITKEYKVKVDTFFYGGPVSVVKLGRKGDDITIEDNTGKKFDIKNTNILNLIKQFKLNKPVLSASDMGVTVKLNLA